MTDTVGFEENDAVEALPAPDDEELASVADLARAQLAAEARVRAAEAELDAARHELAAVRDDALPRAMALLGLADFTLADGAKVQVREAYRCGQLDDAPPDDKRDGQRPLDERLAALAWLDEHGHGDVARRQITVVLGADALELQEEILALLRAHRGANSMRIEQRRVVPWNTLSKLAREMAHAYARDPAAADEPPLELLGVTRQTSARITRSKKDDAF